LLRQTSASRYSRDAPRLLYLPQGDVILCQNLDEGLKLTHSGTGQTAELHGSFALHLEQFITGKSDKTGFGALAHQYPWISDLDRAEATPFASRILLGDGLGMLFIELTDRCNERCIHCYAESSPECSERLELDEIKTVLREVRALGNPVVQFTGGDPLIHPDIIDASAAARAFDYETLEIYTNGLALSDAMLKRLLPYRPNFSFSVYSHDATIHDGITQVPGSHARTLAAIRRAKNAGLAVRIGIILMPENKGGEADTIRFLQETLLLEPAQIGLDVVRSTGRGQSMRDYQPDLTKLHGFGHRPDMPDDPVSKSDKPAPSSRHRGKLCVSANGNVYPCIFSRQTRLGNIRTHGLRDIMHALDQHTLPSPSQQRWQQCRQGLSCSDCQAIAYALGQMPEKERMRNAIA